MKRKKLTIEEHKRLAEEFIKLNDILRSIKDLIGDTVNELWLKYRKARTGLDLFKSALDEKVGKDYPHEDTTRIYYGNEKEYVLPHKNASMNDLLG